MQNSPSPDLKSVVERLRGLVSEIRFLAISGGNSRHAQGMRYAAGKLLPSAVEIESLLLTQKDRLDKLTWQPIETAPKDGTIIWAVFRDDLPDQGDGYSPHRWRGCQLPLKHEGITEGGYDMGWSIRAPVGHGGFADAWIAGWQPLPEPPALTGSHT